MDYKKIITSPDLRTKVLGLLDFIPDVSMLKLQYRIKLNRKLNLNKPLRFTEKLQWYKLYYRKSSMKQCVDKFTVRQYVASKGLDNILNELYGVYDRFEDINFEALPNQFIMKSTNGGGGINVIICKDKSSFNIEESRNIVDKWLSPKNSKGGREWVYYGLKPRIIIEKYLVNEENPEAGIFDYKIFCFNGKAEYLVVDINRYIGHKRNFYDRNWNYLSVDSDKQNFGDILPKPEGLDEMLMVAEELSKDFPFLRVDLYYVKRQVIFGEMTFSPWSGYVQFTPDDFDFILGKHFELPLKENR